MAALVSQVLVVMLVSAGVAEAVVAAAAVAVGSGKN